MLFGIFGTLLSPNVMDKIIEYTPEGAGLKCMLTAAGSGRSLLPEDVTAIPRELPPYWKEWK